MSDTNTPSTDHCHHLLLPSWHLVITKCQYSVMLLFCFYKRRHNSLWIFNFIEDEHTTDSLIRFLIIIGLTLLFVPPTLLLLLLLPTLTPLFISLLLIRVEAAEAGQRCDGLRRSTQPRMERGWTSNLQGLPSPQSPFLALAGNTHFPVEVFIIFADTGHMKKHNRPVQTSSPAAQVHQTISKPPLSSRI